MKKHNKAFMAFTTVGTIVSVCKDEKQFRKHLGRGGVKEDSKLFWVGRVNVKSRKNPTIIKPLCESDSRLYTRGEIK